MRIRRALAAVAISIFAVIAIAGPAGAIRDPFVVCVKDPCPPYLPIP